MQREQMDNIYKSGIISRLKEKNMNKSCPRCECLNFELVGTSYINLYKESWFSAYIKKDAIIPYVIIACSNCGYITQHALAKINEN